ncbi:membrane protein insertion efficiency factor YidD [Flavobacterium sp. CYK-4]|uniref:membrane protein insertion efficiency factor YidD n=1 Tax=Flavobacterium lotistagni TaxID=2709660 RepID=UPI0014086424|nr:membrane protein insertion efficiency factor YidD [Flavobacterium lotistagni]NHM05691.1 membrane protein insertion efficiency factor YidD [Flavobacterium lotistagni]
MKHFILKFIQLYWLIIPEEKRRKCIFRKSCSKYVYEIAKNEGFIKGVFAFHFRYKNCRSGFELFKDPMNNHTKMLLPSKKVIENDDIAERLLILENYKS